MKGMKICRFFRTRLQIENTIHDSILVYAFTSHFTGVEQTIKQSSSYYHCFIDEYYILGFLVVVVDIILGGIFVYGIII